MNATPPLVILALDAGDHNFIQRWAQDGSLPNFARIMRQGCWSVVADSPLFSEFGQWTTMLSGIPRAKHEYYYFRQLRPGTYDLEPFSHLDTGVLPFWVHLRGGGKRTAIIDPPECNHVPDLEGLQLSQWSARHLPQRMLPLSADPPELLDEARHVFGKRIRVVDYSSNSTAWKDRRMLSRMLERIERKGRLCRHLAAKERYDLIVIGYYEGHDASHRFWEYCPESQSRQPGAMPDLAHAIQLVYQAIDLELGLFWESIGSEATIVILSCYGMSNGFPTHGLVEHFCRTLGYQVPRASGTGRNPLDLFRRAIPEPWRIAISDHLPVAVQERLLADRFKNGTNWKRTHAFAIPSVHTSYVRVNVRNREPQGCISPGKAYEALTEEIASNLAQLIDPITGEPAVELIERTAQVTGVLPRQLPDLLVRWKPHTHFIERLAHPRAEIRQERAWFHRASGHSTEGFFAAAGPLIRPVGRIENISTLAIAPMLLNMLGEQIPNELAAEAIPAMLLTDPPSTGWS